MLKGLRTLSFWQQLFSYFLIFIIVPTFVVFFVYSITYVNSTTQNIIQYSQNELEVLDENITNYLNQFKTLSDSILLNSQFLNIINNRLQGRHEYESLYILGLQNTLKDIYTSYKNIDTLIFIDKENTIISVGYPFFDEIGGVMAKYRDQMETEDGKIIWGYLESNKGKKVIICRKINYVNAQYEMKSLGYMIMLIDEQTLYNYYRNLKSVNTSRFYIFNEKDIIISSNMRDEIGRAFSYNIEKDNAILKHEKFIFVSRKLMINDWTIAYLIPKDKINENVLKTLMYIALITIICIILSAASSLLLAQGVNKPLVKLSKSMQLVEKGDFSIIVETRQTNEIGQLYNSFNVMVSRLNQLVNKNMAMEIKTKEAQIQSYQRQIDPHFIYNTLDMIRMLAILNENEKVEETAVCLSEVLRFNLKAEKEVLIKSEIENIEFYFRILKLRYGDNFDYAIKISEEVRQYYTLKFLIQPFIENAVRHGLEKVQRRGYICVIAKKLKGEIVFIIQDNGIGIEQTRIEEIKKILDDEGIESSECIGMKNVHQRIRLQYGPKYGVDIISRYNRKTSIILHIPAYRKKGEMPYV